MLSRQFLCTQQRNLDAAAEIFDYWAGASYQTNCWHEKTCRYVTHDGRTDKHQNVCNCPADANERIGPETRSGQLNIKNPAHLTTEIIPDKVAEFLDKVPADQPFCLSVYCKAPHAPWEDWAPEFESLYPDEVMPIRSSG